jgi:hypothetical protein
MPTGAAGSGTCACDSSAATAASGSARGRGATSATSTTVTRDGLDGLPVSTEAPADPAGTPTASRASTTSCSSPDLPAPAAIEALGLSTHPPPTPARSCSTSSAPGIGPEEIGEGATAIFGLAFTVADLDATAALLGPALGATKDAVQPGRRIATLRHRELDVSVATAFMSAGPDALAATDDAGDTPPATAPHPDDGPTT